MLPGKRNTKRGHPTGRHVKSKGGQMKKLVIGLGLAVIAVIICTLPLKTVAYAVTVPYQATETYYTTEPSLRTSLILILTKVTIRFLMIFTQ